MPCRYGDDSSLRYGVGYILSDGSIGVYFNDSTKIILAAWLRVSKDAEAAELIFFPSFLKAFSVFLPCLLYFLLLAECFERMLLALLVTRTFLERVDSEVPSGDLFDYITSWSENV